MKSERRIHIRDSGFREVFGDGFTIAKLNAILMALAELEPKRKAVVGYDNRFLSEEIAHHAARLLEHAGWDVRVVSGTFPTPGIATLVKTWELDFGLMVTASHNPYYYNGLKLFNNRGALISKSHITALEALAERKLDEPSPLDFQVGWRTESMISAREARDVYFKSLLKPIRLSIIRRKKMKVAWDAFGGTDQELFPRLLDRLKVRHWGYFMEIEPTYHRRRLEPDKTSLKELEALVSRKKAVVGLATDVDGDRFSIVDEKGAYLLNNRLTSLLTWYLLEVRQERGHFFQTVSCSEMTRRIARDFGQEVMIFPVGFRAIGEKMQNDGNALLAMEESGGLAYGPHLPFKDGFMAHLLVLEMLASTEKTFRELCRMLTRRYGPYHYDRVDFRCENDASIERWLDRSSWEGYLGEKIVSSDEQDGEKWYFESGGWLLIRRSKTEPLLRFYFESQEKEFIQKIKRRFRI